MTHVNTPPSQSYGVLQQTLSESDVDEAVEQIFNLGYAVISADYTALELVHISDIFNETYKHYVETYGESRLKKLDEINTVRSPLTHGGDVFLNLALHKKLHLILKQLIPGKFILNQQNAIINPVQETYNQALWHRDLPYQHFVSSHPLAVNALFCVDNFTYDNGATYVLPASHKSEKFPSAAYIRKNAVQIEAKAGSYILLDSMVFHAGGFNTTNCARRAVNQVYTLPYFKQQINIPMNAEHLDLSCEEKDILGFNYAEPTSILNYLLTRQKV